MAAEDSDSFKKSMLEWVSIKKQLSMVRQDVQVLNKREKELRKFIQTYMKSNDIDACNAPGAKVSYTQRKAKGTFNRDSVRKGLLEYFSGNEDQVNHVMDIIETVVGTVHKDSISIRINKGENGVE